MTLNYKIDWEDINLNSAYDHIHEYLMEKYGCDEDGDSNVQFELINRRTHNSIYFQPIPYGNDNHSGERKAATPTEQLEACLFNMSVAQKDLEIVLRRIRNEK